ncbi:MAG: response regulator [Acetobacteraceae bacterium]|nr:response regulator [Acetobacteraceae bacterium]
MHVMLIEDDPLVREVVMDSLSAEGMAVEGLASAEDALVLLGAGQVPDVLVADINLGAGLDGADLVAIARERYPEVEAILISGQSPDEAFGRLGPGHLRFLPKPFAPDALSRAIRDAAADAAATQQRRES